MICLRIFWLIRSKKILFDSLYIGCVYSYPNEKTMLDNLYGLLHILVTDNDISEDGICYKLMNITHFIK